VNFRTDVQALAYKKQSPNCCQMPGSKICGRKSALPSEPTTQCGICMNRTWLCAAADRSPLPFRYESSSAS